MKTKSPKASQLAALLKLVEQRHGARNRKQKARFTALIAEANDAFHARWHEDGLARLLRGIAR